jgi:hypothetical protein
MPEPDDDTEPQATDPVTGRPMPADAPADAPAMSTTPDPTDPVTMPGDPTGEPAPAPPPAAPPSTPPPPAAATPPLSADPNRPADSGWREPPWVPARPTDRRPGTVALIVGLGLIVIGLWFFIDRTLGIALPSIQWRSLWPIVLIVIGGAILLRSLGRAR